MRRRTSMLTDQRGVALPMATLALLILSALIVGFAVLSSTEPTIASNQLMVAQARTSAEAGIERAMWALQNPGDAGGIPSSGTIPAPYNGSQFVTVSSLGGFRVTVASATTSPYPPECPAASSMSRGDRCIVAVGWAPNDSTTAPKAHQKIRVVVSNPRLLFTDPPAALSVRGQLELGGNSLVDSRTDTSCGPKVGTVSTDATSMVGDATDIWGATDGNDIRNEVTDANNGPIPANAHDIVQDMGRPYFDAFALTDADIDALRAYAKKNGTYLQGSVTFNAGNLMQNGIIFIDTYSGNNITDSTSIWDFGSLTIEGNPTADPSGIFSGYIFVNGTLSIDGNFTMHGMAYAQNDIDYHGIGTGGVSGAMIGRNIRDYIQSTVDSDVLGNALVNYNCLWARTAGGTFANRWSITTGSYKELCDSCT
jgi:formylmethanofuran dehydrogenase subunit C